MMTSDAAILLVIADLRQVISNLQNELAQYRESAQSNGVDESVTKPSS